MDATDPIGVVERAIQEFARQRGLCRRGAQVKLAEALQTTPANVSYWLKTGRVSARWYHRMAALIGWRPEDIRPDLCGGIT